MNESPSFYYISTEYIIIYYLDIIKLDKNCIIVQIFLTSDLHFTNYLFTAH